MNRLRSNTFYHLHVHLKQGYDLAARDACGTSDPYVKFMVKGKLMHKSKTIYKDLNPFWDEQFVLAIEDPFLPLDIKVGEFVQSILVKLGKFHLYTYNTYL